MVYDNKNSVYAGLKAYLDTLVADYGLHLVIKDFVGFLEQDMELYQALHAYIIHKTSYCMTIKENHRLWKYCLYSKELLYKKLVKNPEPFIGQCYGGVVEYVLPIVHKKQVIGAITIGYGRLDHKVLEDILKGLNKHAHMDIPILQDYYIESTDVESISPQGLDQRLGILAEYISLIYRPANVLKEKDIVLSKGQETYIMSHAIAYIQKHYKEDIKLVDLSKYCHCSNSYLSHHFKKYTSVTLKTYVNILRVDEAKALLEDEQIPITHMAYELGYKDSNYFSKVFKDIAGVSPANYRLGMTKNIDSEELNSL